jgi:hypothetical protein
VTVTSAVLEGEGFVMETERDVPDREAVCVADEEPVPDSV